jgi:hypothetical protein
MSAHVESRGCFGKGAEGHAGVDEGAEKHVSADAGKAFEVSNAHRS